MLPCALAFATPRKLPKVRSLDGRVVILDIAFAGASGKVSFESTTLPVIDGLGERLAAWVDHHDHTQHARYSEDKRFVLATKAEHGACPEMITADLVERVGPVDTIVCHTDFDGLASAAKWMRGGVECYPGCDDDARAIDTRIGKPSSVGQRFDRAVRARSRDKGLFGVIVRHLYEGLADTGLWQIIDEAAAELIPIERETRRAATDFREISPDVVIVDIRRGYSKVDKTLLLLAGQERKPVSIVVDEHGVTVAAAFDSGYNFLKLLRLSGGMPTRVAIPHRRLRELLEVLGVDGQGQSSVL